MILGSMRINPEFRRNIWIQFNWSKLIAAPLVTVIASYAFLLLTDRNYQLLQSVAELAGGSIILGIWGTRRAADAVAEEVGGGTWESQRMSSLGAWQMTWGKLLGGTSFVWYCAAIAMTVILWANVRAGGAGVVGPETLRVVFNFLVGGLMAQATAFAIGLLLLRKATRHRRLTITLAQSCGFLLFFIVVAGGFPHARHRPIEVPEAVFSSVTIEWYGTLRDAAAFRSATIAIACIWAVIAAYRLMRTELQYRCLPWVWTVFLLFVVTWTAGLNLGIAWAFLALVLLTYVSLFADNRDPVRYRWAVRALRRGNLLEVVATIPWWSISFAVLAILVGFMLPALSPGMLLPGMADSTTPASGMLLMAFQHLPSSLVLVVLFIGRDLFVLLWLSSSPWRAKADVIGIIYLALAYWPPAVIFWVTGAGSLLPVVAPIATGNPAVDFVPILIELAFAALLFYARWREITRLRR
jgi:hypothetical protein